MDSAEDEIYQESVFVRQMERIHQLEWRQEKGNGDEIMNSELERQIGGKHKYTSNSLLPYRILQVCSRTHFKCMMLQGIYIKHVFSKIRGESTIPNVITFVKTVNQKNVDWSLGAAVSKLFQCNPLNCLFCLLSHDKNIFAGVWKMAGNSKVNIIYLLRMSPENQSQEPQITEEVRTK